ncbi:hypothetical protein [Capnocytophaga sp.]|uniref:hypothetical protein n=1 Tax=Capnocytophaga sp. TaxID=44737 RepID=UPI0026DA9B3C|nr:hypothetical protein [Capnocytophaga sp.]MDO5106033.1 hypothetical protein [Capnocytophaga sp.]
MLKTKYPKFGFSKEVFEGVAANLSAFVTEETQVEPAVDGAEQMLKTFQSYADNRVNAFQNESEKYKKEAEELKTKLAGQQGGTPDKSKETTEPEWVKTLLENQKNLQETVSRLQSEKTAQTLKEQFIQKMSELKVPESFYGASILGRDFTDPSNVETLAGQVAENYEKFKQDGANIGFSFTQPPEKGNDPQKEEEALAEQIRQGTKTIVEQLKN